MTLTFQCLQPIYCNWAGTVALVIWAVLGAAQLSGCLSESCYAERQGTSALVMYKYYTCLAVPGYYASHPEVAVLLQRS